MRITQVHHELLALLLHSVTDAVDFELFLKAFGNADDHVVHKRPCQSVERAVLLLIVRTGDVDDAVFQRDSHRRMDRLA